MTKKRIIGSILALLPGLAVTVFAIIFMLDGLPSPIEEVPEGVQPGFFSRFGDFSVTDQTCYLTFIIAPVVLALLGILCLTTKEKKRFGIKRR